MKNENSKLLPSPLKKNLAMLGEQIKLARLRRKLSLAKLSERAGCSELTLIRIEKGNPSVAIGTYARVLYGLGLSDDILLIAKDDPVGRSLQDMELKNMPKGEEYDFN